MPILALVMVITSIVDLVKKPKTTYPQFGLYGSNTAQQSYQTPMNNGMYGNTAQQPYQAPMNNGMYGNSTQQPYQAPMYNGMYNNTNQQPHQYDNQNNDNNTSSGMK